MARMDFFDRDACARSFRRNPCVYAVESGLARRKVYGVSRRWIQQAAQPAISYLTIFIHRREYICTGMDSYSS